jgi:hypothetical protein
MALVYQAKHDDDAKIVRAVLVEAYDDTYAMVRGADDTETLTMRSNSATNLNRMGNHAEAADTLSEVAALQTMTSMSSLATTLFHLGKRDDVAALMRLLGNEALLAGRIGWFPQRRTRLAPTRG